jgi:DHA1 family multidrug resistance protein-like MFS transporter
MLNWRRSLRTLWFTQFIAVGGFSFVTPFLPFYIQDMGVTDVRAVALWTGMASSACSVALALMAPVWGSLSDRYGRKVMVLRATLLGAFVLALQGLAVTPQQLVALRFLQGVFTGTIAASTTLVASIVPEDSRGASLGSLQAAVYLGTTLGPLLGGLSGAAFGYRRSFFITAGLLLLSGILVALFVEEGPIPAPDAGRRRLGGPRQVLTLLMASGGALLAMLLVRLLLRAGQLVPTAVMALFVQSLAPAGLSAAVLTGLVSGAAALGGAIGAPAIGGLGDRRGYRRVLLVSALLLAASFIPQALAPSVIWLIVWQFVAGVGEGGALAATLAILARLSRGGRQGTVFGLDASAAGAASAVGPIIGAASAAAFGLRAPFVLATLILGAGVLVIAARVPPDAPRAAEAAA